MKSVAAILLLACAVSGQLLGAPWGINRAWNAPVAYNTLGLTGTPLAYNAAPIAAPIAGPIAGPMTYSAPAVMPAPMVTSSQYHAQDELGQASFGYAHPGQASANFRDAYGNQMGSYAYINPEGKEVKVSYVADSLGFRVLSNDLPVAPVAAPVAPLPMPMPISDTVEVIEARNAHMAAIEAARSGVILAPAPVMVADLPKPVQDTPEVAAAKAEHMAAKAAAKAAADAAPERKKRQVALALPGLATPASTAPIATPILGYSGLTAPIMGYSGIPAPIMGYSGLTAPIYSGISAPVMAAPVAYSAPIMAAPAVREATLTNIVHTPGHAMSYRVD